MAKWTSILCIAIAALTSTRLVSAQESMDRKETMDLLLKSLFESKNSDPNSGANLRVRPAYSRRIISAPLAHPSPPLQKGAISPSFHLLKVTGAKASVNGIPRGSEYDLNQEWKPDVDAAAQALHEKYDYIHNLRREFGKN